MPDSFIEEQDSFHPEVQDSFEPSGPTLKHTAIAKELESVRSERLPKILPPLAEGAEQFFTGVAHPYDTLRNLWRRATGNVPVPHGTPLVPFIEEGVTPEQVQDYYRIITGDTSVLPEGTTGPIAGGVTALSRTAAGLTSPGMAPFALAGGVVNPVIKSAIPALFTEETVRQIPEAAAEAGRVSVEGNPFERGQAYTQLGVAGAIPTTLLARPAIGLARDLSRYSRQQPTREVPDALPVRETTPVYGDVPKQPVEVEGKVPAKEGDAGVPQRGETQAKEGEPVLLAGDTPLTIETVSDAVKPLALEFKVQEGEGEFPTTWQFNYQPEGKTEFTFHTDQGATTAQISTRLAEKKAQFAASGRAVPETVPVAKPVEPPAPQSKQPWEMTKDEWHDENLDDVVTRSRAIGFRGRSNLPPHPDDVHKASVEQALREGKPVPPEVLADYPDLNPTKTEAVAPTAGPGAKTSGEQKYEAIKQLTDQLEALPVSGAKERLSAGQKLAEKWVQGKSEFERAVAKMRVVSDTLKSTARGVRKPSDLDSKIGEFDYATQRSSAESAGARRAIEHQMPNAIDREASAILIDAGGDTAAIREAITRLPEGTSAHLRSVLERASNPTTDILGFAENLKQFFGIRENDAVASDLFESGLRDYYTHIWQKQENMPESLQAALNSGKVSTYFQFARKRTIPTILEGILQGKKPVLDPAKVVPFYNYAMDRSIASRELIKSATELTAKDGRPLVEPTGIGKVIEPGEGEGAVIISPKAKPEEIGDYRTVDHPALQKWKWITKTEDGQNVFVRGDLVVHPEYFERLARIMDRSRLSTTPSMRLALRLGTEVKAFKLGLLSAFHQVHVGSHAIWHWTNPFRAREIDWESPRTRFAVEKGHLKLAPDPRELNIYAEGIITPGLIHKLPIVGKWSKTYSEWLFGEYIPRLKLATFENALVRNRQAYSKQLSSGKLTESELASRVGDSVNNAYGELNHLFLGKNGRDPRFQRLLGLIFLAPDFGEARLRFVEKAFTRYGHEERLALATMVAAMYATSRIANWMSHGDPEWEWRRAFQVKTGKHWWTMRSVMGDLVHALDRPGQFMYVRLSPLYSRTASDFLLGRDPRTGKRLSGMDVVERLAEQVVPIQLGGLTRDDQKVWESFITSMGVSTQRDTPVMDIQKMASQWRLSKGYEPAAEFIATEAPSFNKLRMGIRVNNQKYAAGILNELRKTRTDKMIENSMANYIEHPFTGSNEHEKEFILSLDSEQKKLYLEARRQQMLELRDFYKLLAATPR